MDCSKCHAQCKAQCCGVVPIPQETFEKNKHKMTRVPIEIFHFDGPDLNDDLTHNGNPVYRKMVTAATSDGKCVFLREDLGCAIYEERPNVCRKYGDETHLLMTCSFQAKDGRIRSRQERRAIERLQEKHNKKIVEMMNSGKITNSLPYKLNLIKE